MSIAKAIAHAWKDEDYKSKLLENPHAALADFGIKIPESAGITVVENQANKHYFVLPAAPKDARQLSPGELEEVAGGAYNMYLKILGVDI